MNSMPAASKAALTSSNVDERLGGTLSTASNLLIVLAVTPDLFANSSVVQRRAFLAERIWVPVGNERDLLSHLCSVGVVS
jgi:hypothetical protein